MNKVDVNRLPDEVRKSIPNNEKIHWNGEPSWASLGYQVFGIKYVEEVLFSSQNCKFPGE